MSYVPLSDRRISNALAGQGIGHDVQVHEEIASTSDHARELGQAGFPHGLVVYAEAQTSGRGRRENKWSSEPGQDLLHSILLRPEVKMEYWPRLTTLAALAICRAIENVTALQPSIKWPNDIFLNDKKVAGILAETFTSANGPFMILGIGLNVNTDVYPPELSDIATSLRLESETGKTLVDRERVAIALLQQLNQLIRHWEQGFDHVITEVQSRSWLIGKSVRALMDGKEVFGEAIRLNEEGHLILRPLNGNLLTLTSAEQVRPLSS